MLQARRRRDLDAGIRGSDDSRSVLGIDCDVRDGKITLSHVEPDVKAVALAAKVDRLKSDLEFRIGAETSRLRDECSD
jgi:hypothetical protein